MITRVSALPALLAASTALVTSALLGASPARADAIGSCTTTHGTIVAVDFSHWGGPIVRGCGVDAATGYDLLHDGGFTTTGDQHDGPAFICRLGNGAFRGGTQYPTPDQDRCVVTPPSSAYWSFWVAPRGQNTWSYSKLGAMSDVPAAGGVELWQFGKTDVGGTEGRPSVSPDSLRAKNTSPAGGPSTRRSTSASTHRSTAAPHSTAAARRPSSTPAMRPTPNAPASTTPTAGAATGDATGSTSAAPRATATHRASTGAGSSLRAAASGAGPPVASQPGAGTGSATPAVVDASPASTNTAAATGGGSPAAVIAGGGLAVVLAAGAGWAIVRRRRTDPDA